MFASVLLPTDSGKTLTFFNHDFKEEFQTVTFEGNEIKKLFHGSFHKVSMGLRKCHAVILIIMAK